MAPARLQRWIAFMILVAALDRVRDARGEPLFLVKGGVAMELRFQLGARATKDLDASFREPADRLLERLDQALREPLHDFRFERSAPEGIGETGALRLEVRVIYRDRVWQRVTVETALAEGGLFEAGEIERVRALDISDFGFDGPDYVACIPIRYQIAQKLHACTERFDTGPENGRFRDLIDLLLLRDLASEADLGSVREACVEIFALRGKHAWPPVLDAPDAWRDQYAALARDLDFEVGDVSEAGAQVRQMISRIHQGRPVSGPAPRREHASQRLGGAEARRG